MAWASTELNSVHAQFNSCLTKFKNVRIRGTAEVHMRKCDAIISAINCYAGVRHAVE